MNRNLWITLGLVLLGGIVGYYGNVFANRKNNELLVQLLKDQLECVDNEIARTDGMQPGRYLADRNEELMVKRAQLESQLQYYSNKFGIS